MIKRACMRKDGPQRLENSVRDFPCAGNSSELEKLKEIDLSLHSWSKSCSLSADKSMQSESDIV